MCYFINFVVQKLTVCLYFCSTLLVVQKQYRSCLCVYQAPVFNLYVYVYTSPSFSISFTPFTNCKSIRPISRIFLRNSLITLKRYLYFNTVLFFFSLLFFWLVLECFVCFKSTLSFRTLGLRYEHSLGTSPDRGGLPTRTNGRSKREKGRGGIDRGHLPGRFQPFSPSSNLLSPNQVCTDCLDIRR